MADIIVDDGELFSHDESDLRCNLTEAKLKKHPPDIITYIRLCYIAGILIWILILHFLKLYKADIYIIMILSIPFFCFLIAFINIENITGLLEDELFKSNYLSIGLVIVIPMLSWLNNDYKGDKRAYTRILVLAIVATLLSMVDIWVSERYYPIVKHIQSICQCISLSLLIYAITAFYLEDGSGILFT